MRLRVNGKNVPAEVETLREYGLPIDCMEIVPNKGAKIFNYSDKTIIVNKIYNMCHITIIPMPE